MKNPVDELYSALSRIRVAEGDVTENCLQILLKVSNTSARRIFGSITCEKDYFIIEEAVFILQSAVLYYLAKALEKQKQRDFISCLVYSSYASGINAILLTKFLPIIQRYATLYRNKEEIESIQKVSSWAEQEINEIIRKSIEKISEQDHAKIKERINRTIQTMISLATNKKTDVRSLAVTLCKKFPAGDFKQARRLYEYVRDEITYIHDPYNIEEVQPPEITLKLRAGDCDDKAVLLAALLLSIGFEICFFITDTNNDGCPDHVYVGVYLPNAPEIYKPLPHKILDDGRDLHDWIPLDPTCEDSDFGVIPINDIGILKYIPLNEKCNFEDH